MQSKYFAMLVAGAIFLFVLDLIRRQKMNFRYSVFWLSACVAVIIFGVWNGLLLKISRLAGFELPSNFIFFLLLAFFTVLSLMLTLYINEQNDRTQHLAQSISALQYRIKLLEKKPGEEET